MARVAVVTGGASGLGQTISRYLARDGRRVAVLDVNADAAEKVSSDLAGGGASAIAVQADVSDPVAVDAAFETVRDKLGPIEVLVTSAAVAGFTRFDQIGFDEWNRYLAVNLTGTFLCLQAALPDMVAAEWGRVVTISSAAGQTGSIQQGHYSASKGGVIALTKTVALEYAAKGITVNTVPPFTVDTPMLREAQRAKKLPPSEILAKAIPAGRLGTGEDIAAICAFLCSDSASYITGQVIGVNGGAVI
jgi:2-hydroxycyclohexanecarboxyl-CoA dehydrogenase